MAEPGLQFKKGHRLFGIVELTGNGRSRTMARDSSANILQGYAGLATQRRNEPKVKILLRDMRCAVAEEKLDVLSCPAIKHGWLHRPNGFPGGNRLPNQGVNRLGKGRACLMRGDIE